MKFNNTKIKTGVVLLASLLIVSCGDSTETSSQKGSNNSDPVVTYSKPTVAFTSQQVNASVGETFTLDISMSNFPVSEGGGVSVKFDASMLNVSDVSINASNLNFVNKVGSIDNNVGVISDILFSSYKGVSGDSQIATITFNAIGSGSSQVILQSSSVNPFSSDGKVVVTDFIYSNVQIAAVQ